MPYVRFPAVVLVRDPGRGAKCSCGWAEGSEAGIRTWCITLCYVVLVLKSGTTLIKVTAILGMGTPAALRLGESARG